MSSSLQVIMAFNQISLGSGLLSILEGWSAAIVGQGLSECIFPYGKEAFDGNNLRISWFAASYV